MTALLLGHSWAKRLENSGYLPSHFFCVARPGATFKSFSNEIRSWQPDTDDDAPKYVFVLLGGNDCSNARNLDEVEDIKFECMYFAQQCRRIYPGAKLILCGVEDRYLPQGWSHEWTIDLDHKRKGNKFNKWLNKFDNKDAMFALKGSDNFSAPLWYNPDGIHLSNVGCFRLASRLAEYFELRKAGN